MGCKKIEGCNRACPGIKAGARFSLIIMEYEDGTSKSD